MRDEPQGLSDGDTSGLDASMVIRRGDLTRAREALEQVSNENFRQKVFQLFNTNEGPAIIDKLRKCGIIPPLHSEHDASTANDDLMNEAMLQARVGKVEEQDGQYVVKLNGKFLNGSYAAIIAETNICEILYSLPTKGPFNLVLDGNNIIQKTADGFGSGLILAARFMQEKGVLVLKGFPRASKDDSDVSSICRMPHVRWEN